jgi:hypothetical protein
LIAGAGAVDANTAGDAHHAARSGTYGPLSPHCVWSTLRE